MRLRSCCGGNVLEERVGVGAAGGRQQLAVVFGLILSSGSAFEKLAIAEPLADVGQVAAADVADSAGVFGRGLPHRRDKGARPAGDSAGEAFLATNS